MPSQQDEKRQAAREVIDILYEISTLLVHIPSIRGIDTKTPIELTQKKINRTRISTELNCRCVYPLLRMG